MFESEPYKPGDAMIDEEILTLGRITVGESISKPSNFQIYSLGRLIESIRHYRKVIALNEL